MTKEILKKRERRRENCLEINQTEQNTQHLERHDAETNKQSKLCVSSGERDHSVL